MKGPEREIRLPFLIVGYKTYLEATGKTAIRLSTMARKVAQRTGISIVLVPQFTDIPTIARQVDLPIFAQHIDPVEPGSHTGHVLAEAVAEAGAVGTFINHSEKKLELPQIRMCVKRAREVGLLSCVCSDSSQLSRRIASLSPDLILIENPELIGTGRAVSSADPAIIIDTLREVESVDGNVKVVCGAGISGPADVRSALDLGVVGVGASSAIIRSPDPAGVMFQLASALKEGWTKDRPTLLPLRQR